MYLIRRKSNRSTRPKMAAGRARHLKVYRWWTYHRNPVRIKPQKVHQLSELIRHPRRTKLSNDLQWWIHLCQSLPHRNDPSGTQHPINQNFEKNFGLFDIIDVEDKRNSNNFVKTMTVFTYLDNEVNKVIEILQLNLYDSLLMYGEQAHSKD